MKQDFQVVSAIRAGWQPLETAKLHREMPSALIQREWQAECHTQFMSSSKTNFILNAPTASGKTNEICWLTRDILSKNPNMKAIIVVPALVIGEGFTEGKELACFDESNIHFWKPDMNLCLNGSTESSNVEAIKKFLGRTTSLHDTNANVLVCTQVSLVNVYKQGLEDEKIMKLFKNFLLVIDEAHHVEHDVNYLGQFTKFALDNPNLNVRLMFVTATMFRTERGTIIPDEHMENFERYNLPYDRYLKTCKYLRSISYDFLLCSKTYEKALWSCFEDSVPKSFVFVPFPNGDFTLGSKKKDVHAIFCAIAQSNEPIIKMDGDVILVKRKTKWIRVLDLVDREEQASRKLLLKRANAEPGFIDVVIALRMMVEGADWRWGQQEVIIGPKNSAVTLLQMVGRVLRDVVGKSHASIKHIIPFGQDQVTNDQCENYLKGLMLAMMMEDAFIMPRLTPGKPSDKLTDILNGDIERALDIQCNLIGKWTTDSKKNPEIENDKNLFNKMVQSELGNEFDVPTKDRIAEEVRASWIRCIGRKEEQRKRECESKDLKDPKVNLKLAHTIDFADFNGEDYLANGGHVLDGFRNLFAPNLIDNLACFSEVYGRVNGLQCNLERLEKVILRYDGKIPNQVSKNDQERKDAGWRNYMISRMDKDEHFRHALSNRSLELNRSDFFNKLQQPKSYDEQNEYILSIFKKYSPFFLPRAKAGGGNEEESAHFNALTGVRTAILKDRPRPELANLIKNTPWAGFFEKNWDEIRELKRAKVILDYCQNLGRIPTRRSLEDSGLKTVLGIKSIATWFSKARRGDHKLKPEKVMTLTGYDFEGYETAFEKQKGAGSDDQLKRALELHNFAIAEGGLRSYNYYKIRNDKNGARLNKFLAVLKACYKSPNKNYQTTILFSETEAFLVKHGYLD